MKFQLAPSLLAADSWRLGEQISQVQEAGVEVLHVDVMDGHFVPNLTMSPDMVANLKKHCSLVMDVHLMVEDPDFFVQPFADAGADWISFHVEVAKHAHGVCQKIKAAGCKAGIVINPGTPIGHLAGMIDHVDFVLVMSVNPGYGGQKFIEATYQQLEELRALIDSSPNNPFIQVDGGVGPGNIERLCRAGMNVAVAGSSVFAQAVPADAARNLISLAEAVHA